MAQVHWLVGIDGDWSFANNWSDGTTYHRPAPGDVATIGVPGTYTVSLTSVQSAASVVVNSAHATLSQAAGAGLTLSGDFNLYDGTVIFRADNTFNAVNMSGGLMEVVNAQVFGNGPLNMSGGEVLAIESAGIQNNLNLSGQVTFAAAHHKTLYTQGQLAIANNTSVTFGAPGQDGHVAWGQSGAGTFGTGITVNIAGGTFSRFGFIGSTEVLSKAAVVNVAAGAKIDADNTALRIKTLNGDGIVTNSGDTTTPFLLDAGTFGGRITGALSVGFNGIVTLTGNSNYSGFTAVTQNGVLFLGDGGSTGSLTGDIVDQGMLFVNHGNIFSLDNFISGAGRLTLAGSGTTVINHANTYSGLTAIGAGTVAAGNGDAFGSGTLDLLGGLLRATATETIANDIDVIGTATIAAAHGKALTLGHAWTVQPGGTIVFGAPGDDGTIVVKATSFAGSPPTVELAAGTVTPNDNGLNSILLNARTVTIDAGATFDTGAFDAEIRNLLGSGNITHHGAQKTVTLFGADFSGVISGPLALDVAESAVLTGANTYTGGTTIDAGAALSLGDGGTTGSIPGNIADNGILIFDRSNAKTISGVISGAGDVEQLGSGMTTLAKANTYTGHTVIYRGTLASAHAGAYGSGPIDVEGGELLIAKTQTLSNQLGGYAGTIAAAHGTTATFAGAFIGNPPLTVSALTFGAAGADGIVVLAPTTIDASGGYTVDIAAGTLRAGNSNFGVLTHNAASAMVEAGATLDIAGFSTTVHFLRGGGTVRGELSTLTIETGNFSGRIAGHLEVDVKGIVTLSGHLTFGGLLYIEASATFRLTGTAAEDFAFAGPHATLTLTNPTAYTGTIHGFAQTDRIDLASINFGGATHFTFHKQTDTLHITDGTHGATLHFVDGYLAGDFHIANDGEGHTLLTTTSAGHSALTQDAHFDAVDFMFPLPATTLAEFGGG